MYKLSPCAVCASVCVSKRTVCVGSLAIGSPLRLCDIRIDKIFVGDVQFEDTVPAIHV